MKRCRVRDLFNLEDADDVRSICPALDQENNMSPAMEAKLAEWRAKKSTPLATTPLPRKPFTLLVEESGINWNNITEYLVTSEGVKVVDSVRYHKYEKDQGKHKYEGQKTTFGEVRHCDEFGISGYGVVASHIWFKLWVNGKYETSFYPLFNA